MSLDRPLRARLLSRGRGSHPRRPGARAGRPRCTHTARLPATCFARSGSGRSIGRASVRRG